MTMSNSYSVDNSDNAMHTCSRTIPKKLFDRRIMQKFSITNN